MKLIFMGTSQFAVPVLDALANAGMQPLLVVSQPDRPAGRRLALTAPPLALAARRLGLALEQPAKIRTAEFHAQLREFDPDVAIVVAYGRILPPEVLAIPRWGCLNVHASLLPRYRGASPVAAALAAGDRETGVTLMAMDEGLDTGAILAQVALTIDPEETRLPLEARLAALGARLLVEMLPRLAAGTLPVQAQGRAQEAAVATYAPPLSRADGEADWSLPAWHLHNRWRAFEPWPGLFTICSGRGGRRQDAQRLEEGERVKLLAVHAEASPDPLAAPGLVLGVRGEALRIGCGGGSVLAVTRLQRAGRGALSGAEFARREPGIVGAIFGRGAALYC